VKKPSKRQIKARLTAGEWVEVQWLVEYTLAPAPWVPYDYDVARELVRLRLR
jgi:hypothetical protein